MPENDLYKDEPYIYSDMRVFYGLFSLRHGTLRNTEEAISKIDSTPIRLIKFESKVFLKFYLVKFLFNL